MFNFIKRLEKVEKDMNTIHDWSFPGYKKGQFNSFLVEPQKNPVLRVQIGELRARISLLESHLNLTYIPASEEKKEARHEEKQDFKLPNDLINMGIANLYNQSVWSTPERPIGEIKKGGGAGPGWTVEIAPRGAVAGGDGSTMKTLGGTLTKKIKKTSKRK